MENIEILAGISHRIRGKSVTLVINNKEFFGKKPYLISVKLEQPETQENLKNAIARYHFILSELDHGRLPDECESKHNEHALTNVMSLHEMIKLRIRDSTVSNGDIVCMNAQLERIQNLAVTEIDKHWIRNFITDMKRHYNVTPNTIYRHISAIKRTFSWAIKTDLIDMINPLLVYPINTADCEYTPADENLGVVKKVNKRREFRFRNANDEVLILNYINNYENTVGLKYRAGIRFLFILGLETSIRMREMYTIELKDFNVKNRTIFLPESKTKNGRSRVVPLSDRAVVAYNEYCEHVNNETDGTRNFNFNQGKLFQFWLENPEDKPISTVEKRAMFKRLQGASSALTKSYRVIFDAIGYSEFKFHDVRHEALSRFAESGHFNELELMSISGHSSSDQLDKYIKMMPSNLVKKMALLSNAKPRLVVS